MERPPGISQETIGGSNPKSATSIFGEAAGIIAGDSWGVLLVEDGELGTIEAGDASFGSYPEVSIARLKYLVNTVLRQTVLTRPRLMRQGVKKK